MEEKVFDKNRSIGSSTYKVFGALCCDSCEEPSDNLYQFRLENGGLSEDTYCSNYHDKISCQSAAKLIRDN